MVIFREFSEAEKVGKAIHNLKKKLKINSAFKFGKTSLKIQEIFFNKLCRYKFEIRVLLIDKVGINDPGLRDNATFFYDYLVRTLLNNNNDILPEACLKINKQMDRKFKNILKQQLQAGQNLVKKFKFSDPFNDALIQFSDMIVGVISKHYTDESILSHKLFNKLVKTKKIRGIWKLRESSNTLH